MLCFPTMNLPRFRSIGMLTAIVAVSIVAPSAFSAFRNAITPHFDPITFGLPTTAREVAKKRTEKTVTFEMAPGKFVSISTGDHVAPPTCEHATFTTLCRAASLVRKAVPDASAASQGPNSPGTATSMGGYSGTEPWNLVNNAKVSDDQYADVFLPYNFEGGFDSISEYLGVTNFGFSIPSSATITGIVGEIERTNNSGGPCDDSIRILKGGAPLGDEKSGYDCPPQNVDSTVTLGGSVDLWGLTWLYSDINASNFGLAYSANSGGTNSAMWVDHMRITVYYTDAVAAAAPFFSWWSLPLMLAGCGWILWKEGYFMNEAFQRL